MYIEIKLSKLPSTIGLESTLKKGDFLYLFYTFENQNYVGLWPDIEYFDIGSIFEEEWDAVLAGIRNMLKLKRHLISERKSWSIVRTSKNDFLILTVVRLSNLIKEQRRGIQRFLQTNTISTCAMECFLSCYRKK